VRVDWRRCLIAPSGQASKTDYQRPANRPAAKRTTQTARTAGNAARRSPRSSAPLWTSLPELHVFDVENGVYGMHKVDGIEVTPGAAATVLRPSGAHVMLEALTRPLRPGTTFPLTSLTFQRAGTLTIEVPVESPEAVAEGAHGLFLTTRKSAQPGAERSGR
jgi:copper(I)-binding protein